MIRIVRHLAIALLAWPAASAGLAQDSALVVAVGEGARMRPIARYAGAQWTATCDLPVARTVVGNAAPLPPLVVSAGAAADGIRFVPRGGREWQALEPVVKRLFDERAREENVAAAILARVAVYVNAIVTPARAATPQVYFFRASKTIPDSRGPIDLDEDGEVDPPGELRIDVAGWVQRTAAGITSPGTNTTLSWEQVDDRPADTGTRRSELMPVGVIRHGGANVWVAQRGAGSSASYALYDVGADGVRLLVRSASC